MSSQLKKLILFVVSSAIVIIFTPTFGDLYEKIIGRKLSSGFLGPENPEYIPGFLLSYAFFASLFALLFININKYKIFGFLLLVILLIELFFNMWDVIIYSISLVVMAWLLAQIILFLYKKFKK